jgi:hypothetical protein
MMERNEMTRKRGGRPQQRSKLHYEVPRSSEDHALRAADSSRRAFVEPELVRHASLTRLTLVSDFGGGGGGGGTFF